MKYLRYYFSVMASDIFIRLFSILKMNGTIQTVTCFSLKRKKYFCHLLISRAFAGQRQSWPCSTKVSELLISPLFKILQKNKSSLGSTSRSRWHYKSLLINREQVWNRSPTFCSTREMGGSAPLFWDVGSEGGNSGGNWRRGSCRSFISIQHN